MGEWQRELWQLLVFRSESARGNPTGVLLGPPISGGTDGQSIASRLGFPDSVFVWPGTNCWETRAFSPSEELSFCSQALIGASAVLRRAGSVPTAGSISFLAGDCLVQVNSAGWGPQDVHWLEMPHAQISVQRSRSSLSEYLHLPTGTRPEIVLDAGRRRVYRLLDSLEALKAIAVSPDQVMRYCLSAGIHGICFLSVDSEDSIALRVFTASLDGQEDSATGGAAAALPEYLLQLGIGRPAGHVWLVNQGAGPLHRRGSLWVRRDADGGVQIGGCVQFVARGMLLPEVLEEQE